MRRTPRTPTPPHLRQVHAAVGRCRPWSTPLSDLKTNLGSEPVAQQRDPTPSFRQVHVAVGRCRPWSTHLSDIETNLGSEPVAQQRDPTPSFRQIAGNCRRRGGSGCGGVSAMDGATEATWKYLRRPPQSDTSRHPTDSQLLPLPLPSLLHGAGAGLQALPAPPSTLAVGEHVAVAFVQCGLHLHQPQHRGEQVVVVGVGRRALAHALQIQATAVREAR